MPAHNLDHLMFARLFMAGMLFFLGAFEIVRPRCFWGLSIYFKGVWRLAMPAQSAALEKERLKRVL